MCIHIYAHMQLEMFVCIHTYIRSHAAGEVCEHTYIHTYAHTQLEKFVYGKLKQLHKLGSEANDPQFCDEVEKYLGEQVRESVAAGVVLLENSVRIGCCRHRCCCYKSCRC